MEYLILLFMTYLGAQASVFFKKLSGMGRLSVKGMLCSPCLYLGGGLYLLAALLNIYVLSLMEYSKVLPLTSLTYVWTLLLACLVLKERVSMQKVCGVLFIMGGAVLIAA